METEPNNMAGTGQVSSDLNHREDNVFIEDMGQKAVDPSHPPLETSGRKPARDEEQIQEQSPFKE